MGGSPSIQLEGDNYLIQELWFLMLKKTRLVSKSKIAAGRPGKIVLEEGKVDLATDFQGAAG